MTNTSATGGYLAPAASPAPTEDSDLENILQAAIAGIVGLDGQFVRARWQTPVPKQPEPAVNWCAFGVASQVPDAGPAITHNGEGDGKDAYARHEELEVLCSFYGPAGAASAARLRDGLAIPQNMEQLQGNGLAFIESTSILSIPEFVNQQWIRRYDTRLYFRRKVAREYPVLNILSAPFTISTDTL